MINIPLTTLIIISINNILFNLNGSLQSNPPKYLSHLH